MAEETLLSAARRAVRFFNIDNTAGGGLISVETQQAMMTLDIQWRKEVDKSSVMRFAEAILHGDSIHREWLLQAAEAWDKQEELPQPRGKGT